MRTEFIRFSSVSNGELFRRLLWTSSSIQTADLYERLLFSRALFHFMKLGTGHLHLSCQKQLNTSKFSHFTIYFVDTVPIPKVVRREDHHGRMYSVFYDSTLPDFPWNVKDDISKCAPPPPPPPPSLPQQDLLIKRERWISPPPPRVSSTTNNTW